MAADGGLLFEHLGCYNLARNEKKAAKVFFDQGKEEASHVTQGGGSKSAPRIAQNGVRSLEDEWQEDAAARDCKSTEGYI